MSFPRPAFPVRRSASPVSRRRRRLAARRGHATAGNRLPALALESLESRALLAVTANLVGTDLQIALGAADDVAYLSNDGTNYIIRGTGLSGYAAALANVDSVSVAGTAAPNQSFGVVAGVGNVLLDRLSVAGSVENTSIAGGVSINTLDAISVNIGSSTITLAADVQTFGDQYYSGAVGLVGVRTLTSTDGVVYFLGSVDSSPTLFADPDAFAAGTALTTAYAGITLSDELDNTNVVESQVSGVATATTGDYAPTGNRVFGSTNTVDWNGADHEFRADFASAVTSVSLDFAPNDDNDPNAYLLAYDALGTLVASATYAPAIPEQSFVTLTVSAPNIAYVLASFDPTDINTGLLDNLRATLATTPNASLTVNSSASFFRGFVGNIAPLANFTTNGDDSYIDGGGVTTTGYQAYNAHVYISDALDNSVVLTAGGNVIFSGRVDTDAPFQNLLVSATGMTFFGDGGADYVGGLSQLASLNVLGATTFDIAPSGGPFMPSVTTKQDGGAGATGNQTYGGQVALRQDTVLTAYNGGDIAFLSRVEGEHALAVNTPGITLFNAAVGSVRALESVLTDGPGTTQINGASITTTGLNGQVYSDNVTLPSDTILVAVNNGPIAFQGTLDGPGSLFTRTQGITSFGGRVGFTAPLKSILTDQGGVTRIAGDTVKTQGVAGQNFNAAVELLGDTTFTAAASGPIRFVSTIDGAFRLVANTAGLTFFGGFVGNTTPLTSLATDGGDITIMNGGGVRTTGALGQVYGDPTTLGANTTLTAGGNGPITFVESVDGGFTLAANTSGTTTFGGKVGNGTPLLSLTTDAGGSTAINGGSVTTSGAAGQVYNDDVTLGSDAVLAANTGGAIAFAAKLDGTGGLTAQTTGATTFGGAVGGTTALAFVATNAGGMTAINGGVVKTSSVLGQVYGDPVSLGQDAVLTAGASGPITFASALDGPGSLTANTDGLTIFGGSVGTITPLKSLTTDGPGLTVINTKTIVTNGLLGQTYGDDVILATSTSLDSSAGNGPITFAKMVNGAYVLDLNAGTGAIAFNGNVGNGAALAGVVVRAASTTTAVGSVKLDGSPKLAADGLTFYAGVNNVSMPNAGSDIRNFTGNGVHFLGGSTASTLSGFTVADNGGNGFQLDAGNYAGSSISTNTVTGNDMNGLYLNGAAGALTLNANLVDSNSACGILAANSTNVTISNSTVTNNGIDGVAVVGGTGLITQNTINNNGGDGVRLYGSYNVIDNGNTINNNKLNGIEVAAGLTGLTISGNAINANALDGIRFNGGVTNFLVLNNQIATNGSDGIQADAGSYAGTTISANSITDNGDATTHVGNGISVFGSNLMIGWSAEAGNAGTVGNTITGNALNGIEVRGGGAVSNSILSNSIYLNGYVKTDPVLGTSVVGEGIALTDGGNNGQVAPVILRAVAAVTGGVTRVTLVVPADGEYYVQLFDNTDEDERGIFPVDTNGFEGRTYVGDGPAQSNSAVTTGKPAITGTLLAGNTLQIIEIPAGRVPAGNWITATATKINSIALTATTLNGTTPTDTSPFSAGFQAANAPTLAVGADAPAAWKAEFSYQVVNQNQLRVTGQYVSVAALKSVVNKEIVLTTADGSTNVSRTVTGIRCLPGNVAVLTLAPGDAISGPGFFTSTPSSLPAARLYDTSDPTAAPILDVSPTDIATALQAAGATATQAGSFANRFQGGLRVSQGDFDGDGFADLVTAPGAIPTNPCDVTKNLAPLVRTLGNTPRIITIYNGNTAGTWQSASVDVTSVFGNTYTGGFLVTVGDVRPDITGQGSSVVELIVASTRRVAVYEVNVSARGDQPTIVGTPTSTWLAASGRRITGLTAGDFSTFASDEVVVATTTTSGDAVPGCNDIRKTTAFVQTFGVAGVGFSPRTSFSIASPVQNGPAPGGYAINVFYNGAGLAAGDINGELTFERGVPKLKPELVLAANANGQANFRVLANELVYTGVQAAIGAALRPGVAYTQASRPQYANVAGKNIWQPAGGPDYFTGINPLLRANALGVNAPLSVAVVDADGKDDARSEVFAALGAVNGTNNAIRRISWDGSSWVGASTIDGPGTITVQPDGFSPKTRFASGRGLRLG